MMTKIIYGLIAVAVIAGLYLVIAGEPVEAPTTDSSKNISEETSSSTYGSASSAMDEEDQSDVTSESEGSLEAESEASVSGANDFGMEFPVPDAQ